MQYQNRSVLGYTVLGPSEEVFLRSWSLLLSHVRVASQQLQKSTAGQLIIAVSSTSPNLPTACPCTMDVKSRFSRFSSWIPCLSPGDRKYLLNFPFFSPTPLPSDHLQVFVCSRPDLSQVLIFSLQWWLLLEVCE